MVANLHSSYEDFRIHFTRLNIFLFMMLFCICLCVYLFMVSMEARKSVEDSMGLELQIVVKHHIDAKTGTCVFWKNVQCL